MRGRALWIGGVVAAGIGLIGALQRRARRHARHHPERRRSGRRRDRLRRRRRCIGKVDCPQGSTCCAKLDMVTGASGHDKWQSFCRATSCCPGETEMCTGAPGDGGGDPMCLSFASAMPGMRYFP